MQTDKQPSPFTLPLHSRERRYALHGKRAATDAARPLLPGLLDFGRDPDGSLATLGWVYDDATNRWSGPAVYSHPDHPGLVGHLTSSEGDGGDPSDFAILDGNGHEIAMVHAPLPTSRQGSTL